MRQIFKAGQPVAWIGASAPVPEGWCLDPNKAFAEEPQPRKEVIKNAVREEEGQGREEALAPDIAKMPKDELEAFAREMFGVELDKRRRLEALQEQVQALMGE